MEDGRVPSGDRGNPRVVSHESIQRIPIRLIAFLGNHLCFFVIFSSQFRQFVESSGDFPCQRLFAKSIQDELMDGDLLFFGFEVQLSPERFRQA